MENMRFHPAMNLLLVGLVLLGVYLGQNILIPLVLGMVVWYLINAIGSQFGKIQLMGKKIPNVLRISLSVLLVFSFFWFIGRMVISNLEEFKEVAPEYNRRILDYSQALSEKLNIPTFETISREIDLGKIAGTILNSSLGFLTTFFVVVFYVIFLMLEQQIFMTKLNLIFTDKRKKLQFFQIIERIDTSVKSYVFVKTLISFLVSVCAYIVLLSFGVDFAILWAFLTFLLNYIPFVGSFIAIILPTFLSMLQFGDPLISGVLFLILMGIQVLMGNFIEPKMVGKSLNLSPLVVVLALAFWGALWGIAGMFLCVPITVALMIILSQFQSTRSVAILLSAGNDPSAYKRPKNVGSK
ncbi:MAG: AI-2E family transporter [Crocinitomicaceae bacterium]